MSRWVFGLCALLCAGAARADVRSEPYAKVGDWEITAEGKQRCSMMQMFDSKVADELQVLGVVYDGQKGVALSWASKKPKHLPASGSLELDLAFANGSSWDESWGSLAFNYRKVDGTYYFTHVFDRPKDVEGILRDLSANEMVSLFLGPTVMMGLPLDAAVAVETLRECTSNAGGVL